MSARRRRGAATGGSPVGRSCICLPRAARRDRGWRRDETISCLHEKRCVAAGTVDDAEWLSHAVGLRLPMGQAAHWRDRSYEPGVPPCGIVWLPDGVGQWQGGVGGFFVCVGSLFRSLVYEYVHYLFRIWASRWNLCGTPVDVVLACVRSGMRVESVFEI